MNLQIDRIGYILNGDCRRREKQVMAEEERIEFIRQGKGIK
jgi:hypothetical protein